MQTGSSNSSCWLLLWLVLLLRNACVGLAFLSPLHVLPPTLQGESIRSLLVSSNSKKVYRLTARPPTCLNQNKVIMHGKRATTTLHLLLEESPFLQSIFSFCCQVYKSSKTTLAVFVLTPIRNVALYQPPVGIVTWWVTVQWFQKHFFPSQDFFLLEDFPLIDLFQKTGKQRPKSVDIDVNDREYNTLGGVQSQAMTAIYASKEELGFLESSSCSPRASRSQCARQCVQTLFEYPTNKDGTATTNSNFAVLLEVRALDALLRCLRDEDLIVSADQLRTAKELFEERLNTYSTSTRQWIQRVALKLLSRIRTVSLPARWTKMDEWMDRKATSLSGLRTLYQETANKLEYEYDKLGQVQQLLLEQPHNNNGEDSMDAQQHWISQFIAWNGNAKRLLKEILIEQWSDSDDQFIQADLQSLEDPVWSLQHWKSSLALVEKAKLRRELLQGQFAWKLSEWKTALRILDWNGIPSALFKIAIAKCLHNSLAPHWPQIQRAGTQVGSALWGIVEFRFYMPLKVIVLDLLNRRPRLLDPTQLNIEQESLLNMLRDLGISSKLDKATALAEASRMYEQQLKHGAVRNMIFGRTVRLLLIQVQQLKSELLQAFQSIDELVDANRLNVSLLATIPAFLLVKWGSRFLYALLYRVRVRDLTGLKAAHLELTNLLRQLEQLLIMADESKLSTLELGEFISYEQKYLLFLDFCQPPFPMKQVDSIYQDMQNLMPQGGLDKEKQLRVLRLIHLKNADLLKSL